MVVNCESCAVRGLRCHDCVIGTFLDTPPRRLELNMAEQGAINVLVAAGLVPPLRLVALPNPHSPEGAIA